MKQIFLTIYVICSACCCLMAQKPISDYLSIPGFFKKDYELRDESFIKKGTPAVLQFITKLKEYESGEQPYQAVFLANNKQFYIPLYALNDVFQAEIMSKEQFWQLILLEETKYFIKNDDISKLQREQILEAERYIEELEKANLFYNDAAIEDYLQCLILEITPTQHTFKREIPQPVVRVIKSASPDIMMLSNNMLLISTGMLTTLDTEEELVALLCREVSHYLLDHALITVKKNISLAKRAEFWGAIADGVLAATEEFLYYRYEHYTPGLLFDSNKIIQQLINQDIIKRMGLDYSEEQEKEADRHALRYLENENRNPDALRSALYKIKVHYENDKASDALTKYGIYGTLLERVDKMGKPQELPEDRKYLKTMMSIVNYEATMHDYYKDYENSFRLAMKNINHSLGTSDDYLIVARSLMKRYNSPESNAECMLYLDKADMISETENINITKMRILLLLREKKQTQAVEQLKKYQHLLDIMFQQPHTEEDAKWISEEYQWAKKLLERLFLI